MASPTVLERLTTLLQHRYVDGDLENNALLDAIIGAIADAADRVGLVAFGTDEIPPGRALSDPSVAPDWAVAHAALYTGAILPGRAAGEAIEDYLVRARAAAVFPSGIRRGSHEAIRRAIQPLLTGSKTVFIADPPGDYDIVVRTITSETPDPAAVQLALEGSFVSGGVRGAIRAELRLNYIVSDAVTWAEGTAAWQDVADGVTWDNVTEEDVT